MAAQFAPAQIFHAAASGDARQVQEWLAGGGDPNADAHPHDLSDAIVVHILEDGLRLLGVAAWHGRCEVIRLLLAAGANVNYYQRPVNHFNASLWAATGGHHALLKAVTNGKFDAARVLVENGADVNYDSNNPEGREPPPRCTYPSPSVAMSAASGISSGHPCILKMLLMAGLNTAARSCHDMWGLEYTPEEFVRYYIQFCRNAQFVDPLDGPSLVTALEESLEILERLRLAEDHILSVSKEFLPFKTLLWNGAFRNGGRVGPRTTDAIARLFGRNKTGALADVPDGVFWLIVQFFVAGDMRPHVTPVAST